MGRAILFLGLVLVLIGGVLLLGEKYGVKNPLDVRFGGENLLHLQFPSVQC